MPVLTPEKKSPVNHYRVQLFIPTDLTTDLQAAFPREPTTSMMMFKRGGGGVSAVPPRDEGMYGGAGGPLFSTS
jgi:hypothetical protein